MDWILDNLQLVIVIAGAIAYWINQRAREKAGQEADYDEDGIPENRPAPPMQRAETRELTPASRDGGNSEQEERARRIREEIQRKIAERRGQAVPPPMPAPPRIDPFRPVFQEEAPRMPPPLRREEPPAPPPLRPEPVADHDDSAAIERQRRLAEQLAQLEEQRRETRRAAQRAFDSTEQQAATAQSARAAGVSAGSLSAELRDPRSLRRAFLLREILDTPVALR
jgi:hypothetical protein